MHVVNSVSTMPKEDDSPYRILVKLCSDKAAYEARISQKLSIHMPAAKQALEKAKEHEILIYTPHILIIRSQKAETTLSKDGRMIIKRVSSESEAAKVAQQILQTVGKCLLNYDH